MDPLLYNMLVGVLGALVYAIIFYAKNNTTDIETFDWVKFASTLVVGGALGFISVVFLGAPVAEDWVFAQLAAYAGATAIVENIIKIIVRYFKPPAPPA